MKHPVILKITEYICDVLLVEKKKEDIENSAKCVNILAYVCILCVYIIYV